MRTLFVVIAGMLTVSIVVPSFGDPGNETKPLDIELASIKGGCFKMGDSFGDGFENEKPVRDVCVSDFKMGKYTVTQGQWKQVMGNNPSYFKTCGDNCPVENVNWTEVQEFIARLSTQNGRIFRLPTEAEWEYACRGGKSEKYCGSNDVMKTGWYFSVSGDRTHPVGEKKPNELGLYDMSGNVWEWISDWYEEKYAEAATNPQGPAAGSYHVIRGGSWFMLPRNVRSSNRSSVAPGIRAEDLGFRLVTSAE